MLTRGNMYGVCGCMDCQVLDESSISLFAGYDLFMRYVTHTSAIEYKDIEAGKAHLIERGERFGEISQKVSCFYYRYLRNINCRWFGEYIFRLQQEFGF